MTYRKIITKILYPTTKQKISQKKKRRTYNDERNEALSENAARSAVLFADEFKNMFYRTDDNPSILFFTSSISHIGVEVAPQIPTLDTSRNH